ncbi:MAG: hypothetical protein ACI3ZT_06950 [Candidatus Cryptobacteroides sp.]
MKRSSIRRFLILSSLCVSILLPVSCAPKLIVSDVVDVGFSAEADRSDFVFKAGRRELSGFIVSRPETLLLADGSAEEGIRVIGSTYFGMMLFDITVTPDTYKMNSCADFLDRKVVAAFLASRLREKFL